MSSFHRLDARSLAALPWREFRCFYRALMWREASAWRAWVIGRLDEDRKEKAATEVTEMDVLAAFGLSNGGLG